jgi:hypothetical protein
MDSEVAEDPNFPAGAQVEDYLNTGIGADLSYAAGPWVLFAEGAQIGYDVPNVAPRLTANSYYVELVRRFGPVWSVGARQEGVFFSDVTSSAGVTEGWDYDLTRWEFAVNLRFRANARVRLDYQITDFPEADALSGNLVAVQLQAWTR